MPEKTRKSDLPLIEVKPGSKSRWERVATLRKGGLGQGGGKGKKRGRMTSMRGGTAPATKAQMSLSSRRVVVKARVVKMSAYGAKAARMHIRYLEREGTGPKGEKSLFYDAKKQGFSRKDLEAQLPGEPHQFRFIVSPEDGARLDLTEYTKELMGQVEKDLDRELDWVAINHHNTDNPHTHIVVHGLDRRGNELFIDREYISNGMRSRAMEIATNTLGHRMEHEIKAALKKEVKTRGVTALDREINGMQRDGSVEVSGYSDTPAGRLKRSRLIGRLSELERMGFAHQENDYTWEIDSNLIDKLKNVSQYDNAVTKLRDVEMQLEKPASQLLIYDRDNGHITGLVIDKGLEEDLYDRAYAIVGDDQGKLHYVSVSKTTDLEHYPDGGVVEVTAVKEEWVKQSDRNIEKYAKAHSGQYSPEKHGMSAVKGGVITHEKLDGYIEAHERRVKRLARIGMAQELSGGMWKIPDNLTQQLSDIAHNVDSVKVVPKPVHALTIEQQERYPGPTWLDKKLRDNRPEELSDKGAAGVIKRSMMERVEWLESKGLKPGLDKTAGRLMLMEMEGLAEQVADITGQKWRQLKPGESFHGKAGMAMDTPSARKVVIVENGKEFAMVPWKSNFTPAQGKDMEIGINRAGKVWSKVLQRGIER